MTRTARPAVDPKIIPGFGTAKNGQPLSYNRAPAADLAGWIARLSVTKFDLPEGYTLSCGLFSDTPAARIQLTGLWEYNAPGEVQPHGQALFFGPHTKRMPVRISGSFISLGLSFRPSASNAWTGQASMASTVDRIVPIDTILERHILSLFPSDGGPEDWLCAIEDLVRFHIEQSPGVEPEPITARFEEIAFLDPGMSIAQAAREIGVDRRRLERLVVRDFGMPPKQVLKRARALDMASYLRGVADDDEGEALALRYYDESHLIREFVELFGMSPRQFTIQAQPLLTLTLEARQARRLEMMNRLAPGARRPWE
jgi:AraC-like DNA-binding protein